MINTYQMHCLFSSFLTNYGRMTNRRAAILALFISQKHVILPKPHIVFKSLQIIVIPYFDHTAIVIKHYNCICTSQLGILIEFTKWFGNLITFMGTSRSVEREKLTVQYQFRISFRCSKRLCCRQATVLLLRMRSSSHPLFAARSCLTRKIIGIKLFVKVAQKPSNQIYTKWWENEPRNWYVNCYIWNVLVAIPKSKISLSLWRHFYQIVQTSCVWNLCQLWCLTRHNFTQTASRWSALQVSINIYSHVSRDLPVSFPASLARINCRISSLNSKEQNMTSKNRPP